ncbi:MAG: hypothetical protein Q4A11_07330 [Brachymonas sp.]|nr:hypothetical protein [Brachymonas sp.]
MIFDALKTKHTNTPQAAPIRMMKKPIAQANYLRLLFHPSSIQALQTTRFASLMLCLCVLSLSLHVKKPAPFSAGFA